jgi:8-oxo-dGTP pyrophosphatase MutT (NUDIX family)
MDEAAYVRRAIEYIENNPGCFEREHGPVHVTGSAWVVNPDRSCVLLVHHGKLHEWYQPGGHADGDPDVLRVALREATEESGVDDEHIHLVTPEVFDVDIHMIPASTAAPAHGHIDIRFLLEIDDVHDVPGSHESHEVRWIELHRVSSYNNNRSTYRMIEKTRQMRRWLAA